MLSKYLAQEAGGGIEKEVLPGEERKERVLGRV